MSQRNKAAPKAAQTAKNPLLAARNVLEQAEKARKARQFDQAQRACEAVLKQFPDYVAALHTLGMVHADKGEFRSALSYLVQASMLNPQDWSTLTVLSGVYLQLGSGTTALRTLEQARAIKPDDPNILATLGEINREEREFAAGAEVLRRALEIDPDFNAARFTLGICCTELGEVSEAADAFETLVAKGLNNVHLLYALGHLPTSFIKSDILALADALNGDGEDDKTEFESMRAFSRAAALHHAGRPQEAWQELARANAPVRERMREAHARHRRTEQTFLDGMKNFKHPKSEGDIKPADPVSLFILGPSRCGKTSLERLLGAHKDVKHGHESPIVENAVRQTFQAAALPTRERIFELPSALNQHFRDNYHRALADRAGDARVFTNTHPAHIFSSLRLALVLPEARFVFVRRNLDDMALRISMKRYRAGNAYSYGQEETREHLDWYYQMIDLVSAHIPERCLTVEYEQMIENPADTLDAVVRFCGLKPAAGKLPALGDDRGCADPYLELMKTGS